MKSTIKRIEWDIINNALSAGLVACSDPTIKERHPDWEGQIQAARQVIIHMNVEEEQ